MPGRATPESDSLTLFLCGDVMLGRGIDQIQRHPSRPEIHEPDLSDARDYIELAERRNGPIPRRVPFDYVWGDALDELFLARPDVRIVNLETSVTCSEHWEPKGINYRMHPENLGCLGQAHVDCCVLANNHVLDYGREGLVETLRLLHDAGIETAGAGRDVTEAAAPAVLSIPSRGRVLVLGFGFGSSGIPPDWAATRSASGVNLIAEAPEVAADRIGRELAEVRQPGDVVVASVHSGGNWGFSIPGSEVSFAHALIETAGVDVVHGHSSHHPKGIEVHRGKLVLYGCGDFLNDYEGIRGYEEFRTELALMYFPSVDAGSGRLRSLRMRPMRLRRFRLERAGEQESAWLADTLNRACAPFGTRVELDADRTLALRWH